MPTPEKIDRVQELKEQLERCTITLSADYTRTSVNQMTELRRAMRAGGIDFTVVKNTLMYLAAEEAGKPQVKDIIQGPTAVAFGFDDPAAAAKTMADYARANANTFFHPGRSNGRWRCPGSRRRCPPRHPATEAAVAGHVVCPDAGAHVPPCWRTERAGPEPGQCTPRPNAPTGRRLDQTRLKIQTARIDNGTD